MKINDRIFGELEYDYMWFKDVEIDFFEKKVEIVLSIDGEENAKFDNKQYEAYNLLIENWNEIQNKIVKSILDYYKEKRSELGYDITFNEKYKLIETFQELMNNITLVGINIPYGECFDGLGVGITFDCTWDKENGVGVQLVDGNVILVGYQDITM